MEPVAVTSDVLFLMILWGLSLDWSASFTHAKKCYRFIILPDFLVAKACVPPFKDNSIHRLIEHNYFSTQGW